MAWLPWALEGLFLAVTGTIKGTAGNSFGWVVSRPEFSEGVGSFAVESRVDLLSP
jgi:hypothetical protein